MKIDKSKETTRIDKRPVRDDRKPKKKQQQDEKQWKDALKKETEKKVSPDDEMVKLDVRVPRRMQKQLLGESLVLGLRLSAYVRMVLHKRGKVVVKALMLALLLSGCGRQNVIGCYVNESQVEFVDVTPNASGKVSAECAGGAIQVGEEQDPSTKLLTKIYCVRFSVSCPVQQQP